MASVERNPLVDELVLEIGDCFVYACGESNLHSSSALSCGRFYGLWEESLWSVNGGLIYLKRWQHTQSIEEIDFSYASLWVQTHGSKLDQLTPRYAGRIGRHVSNLARVENAVAGGFLESSSSCKYYSSSTVPYLLVAGYLFQLPKVHGLNTSMKNPPFWRSLGVLATVMAPLRDLSLFFIFFSSFSSDSLTFSSIPSYPIRSPFLQFP
ncbi:hypothetical protein SLEP1_g57101 [Rubroshorea leprosula]|uniref:DUF4283 domain-containing protein n=1 Tax=Rubroshorea leprosula TaxID=152421 RepID=A0AAV5MKG6_9ROSI|nr:hypothetical protein SLEP1_g57101 [Rubroshorea leprosula]